MARSSFFRVTENLVLPSCALSNHIGSQSGNFIFTSVWHVGKAREKEQDSGLVLKSDLGERRKM